jgi:hypothetical protein
MNLLCKGEYGIQFLVCLIQLKSENRANDDC